MRTKKSYVIISAGMILCAQYLVLEKLNYCLYGIVLGKLCSIR